MMDDMMGIIRIKQKKQTIIIITSCCYLEWIL